MGDAGGGAEARLHQEIPLSAAMGTRVVEATPGGVVLAAPLEPNVNHRATAFGGSVAALALLAGWMLVDARLQEPDLRAHTVVQTSEVRFLAPAEADLEARALPPEEPAWARFLRTLRRRGRARLRVEVEVRAGDVVVATLHGAYVSFLDEDQEVQEDQEG